MNLGNKHTRLEKRINAALLSGNANPREAIFLHKISIRIDEYGKNTHLSDKQVKWLSEILNRLSPMKPQTTPPPPTALQADPEISPPDFRVDEKSNEAPSPKPTSKDAQPILAPPVRGGQVPFDPRSLLLPEWPRKPNTSSEIRAEDRQFPEGWTSRLFATLEARRKHAEILRKLGRRL